MTNDPTPDASDRPGLVAVSLGASLTVADVARSRDWYRDVLGFAVDREYARDERMYAVALRAGAVSILVTQDDGSKGDRVKGEGFSLMFTITNDVDALALRATAAGAVLDTPPSDAFGARVFRLRDPDGFRLVISSQRAG